MKTENLAFIRTLTRQKSSIVLEESQSRLVEARLQPIALGAGARDADGLLDLLRAQPAHPLRDRVVEAMTTNETFFFRDYHPYEALRKTVIPSLLEANRAERRLSILSAACSTGQEPYGIAMVLLDRFPELAGWKVAIQAVDFSAEMVRKTQEGIFTQSEVNRGLPAPYLVRFFDQPGPGRYQVKPELRRMVECRRMNLAADWALTGPFDVVFLRNVLIYFDKRTKEDILERVRARQRPGGALFLGGAESLVGLSSAYLPVRSGDSIHYRLKG